MSILERLHQTVRLTVVCFDGKWKFCEFLHTFIWSSTWNPTRVNPISRNIGQPELSKNEGGWVFLWPNNECRAWIVSTGGHHSSSQIFWMHEKIGWLEAHEASTLDIWSCENLTTSKIQLSILTRCRGNDRWMLFSAILWMQDKLPTIRQGKFWKNGQNLKQYIFQGLGFRQIPLDYNPFLW